MKSLRRTVLYSGMGFNLVPLKPYWAKPRVLKEGGAYVLSANGRVQVKTVRTYFHGANLAELKKILRGKAKKLSCNIEVAHNVYDNGQERVSIDYRVNTQDKATHKLRVTQDADVLADVPLSHKSMATVITLPCKAGALVVWNTV